MEFRKGQKVEVFQKSTDEAWEPYMDEFIGVHGMITDPDTATKREGKLFSVFLPTGLKGRIGFPKYSFREGKFYDCIFDGYCLRHFKSWVFHFIGS